MVATAYKAIVTARNSAGQVVSIPMTADDVTAHSWTYPDGSSTNKISSLPAVITDVIFASTDISQIIVYINGFDTGIRLQKAASAGTTVNRQVQSAPIQIPAGAMVQFVQLT